ncbi:MAG TPA: zinc ribbon domain-containing protein [Thermoleophilia bacterium]|nr:zinc ribbon domain-containing protein [Thermoleophilia bacterium]
MPIYEYRCGSCGHTFEVLQKFDDPAVETCDVCRGRVARVFHPVAIHFRGSGFYTTDYGRSSSGGRGARDEGDGKAGGEAGEGRAGDSKAGKEGSAKDGAKDDSKGGAASGSGKKESGAATRTG